MKISTGPDSIDEKLLNNLNRNKEKILSTIKRGSWYESILNQEITCSIISAITQ